MLEEKIKEVEKNILIEYILLKENINKGDSSDLELLEAIEGELAKIKPELKEFL